MGVALYVTITTIKLMCSSLNFIEQTNSPFICLHFVLIKFKVPSTVQTYYSNSDDSILLVRISNDFGNWSVIYPSFFRA
jgi:hypothetical protein